MVIWSCNCYEWKHGCEKAALAGWFLEECIVDIRFSDILLALFCKFGSEKKQVLMNSGQ